MDMTVLLHATAAKSNIGLLCPVGERLSTLMRSGKYDIVILHEKPWNFPWGLQSLVLNRDRLGDLKNKQSTHYSH
jgi:hypothetical protein